MGFKIVLMKKWVVNEAVSLIKEHNVISLGAVPRFVLSHFDVLADSDIDSVSVIMDLLDTELSGHPIDGVTMGGSAVSSKFPSQAKTTFPAASLYVLCFVLSNLSSQLLGEIGLKFTEALKRWQHVSVLRVQTMSANPLLLA